MATNIKVFQNGDRLPETDLNEFIGKYLVAQVDNQADLPALEEYGIKIAFTMDTEQLWIHSTTGGWVASEQGNYLTLELADARYLTQLTAEGLFLKLEDSADFLTGDQISTTYLAKLTAEGLYLSQTDATNNYLGKTEAANTYLATLTAQGLYLSKTDAANTYITEISAGNLFISKGSAATDINNNSTTINGGKITTGTISASAISAGTLTGFTIQTSSSGRRVVISNSSNAAIFYNDNGTESFRLSGSSGTGGIYDASALHSFQVGGSTVASINSSGLGFVSGTGIRSDLPVQGSVNATAELTAGTYVRSNISGTGGYATLHSNGGISSTSAKATALNPTAGQIKAEGSIQAGTTLVAGVMATSVSTNAYVRWNGGALLQSSASDARVKDNIEPLKSGLEFINALRPVTFNSTIDDTDDRFAGFIAQEVEQAPFLDTGVKLTGIIENASNLDHIDTSVEGPVKSFSYEALIPYLAKSIQELSAKNDALEARLAVLEGN